jgi:Ca2+-binding RTX toxin-like protein
VGGPGDDRLVGGTGLDSAQFFDASNGIQADLTTGVATGLGSDALVDIEGLVGSNFDDVLIGDDGTNGLFGQEGDDVIRGLGSGTLESREFDVLAGDDGADRIDGGEGFDLATYGRIPVAVSVDLAAGTASGQGDDVLTSIEGAIGSVLDDILVGDALDNAFAGGLGDDAIDGAAGIDTAIFADVTGPVTVDLASGTATGAGADALVGVENVWGSSESDILLGNDLDNALFGFRGDDQISGAAGDDLLVGGPQVDSLDGGDGSDTCLSGAVTINCEAEETGSFDPSDRRTAVRAGMSDGWWLLRRSCLYRCSPSS